MPTPDEVTKRFRRLSIKIHPDKNLDDYRAPMAFDYLNKAHKMLIDDDMRTMCERVLAAAQEEYDENIRSLKQRAAREGRSECIPEAEPEFRVPMLLVRISKLFVKIHQEKERLEAKDADERKRQREMEITAETKRQKREEFEKTWEAKRDKRVDSWRTWAKGSKIRRPPSGQ
jgi:DnaJ homolog subfamily C member 8